jgi:hypothetical protein
MSLAAGIGPAVGGELVHRLRLAQHLRRQPPGDRRLRPARGHGRAAGGHPEPHRRAGFDVVGSLLLAAALTALVLGLESGGSTGAVLLGACAVLLVPFVWWERRAPDPIMAFALFTAVPFTAGLLLVALQNLVMYALLFELPQVLAALLAARSRGRRPAARVDDGGDGPGLDAVGAPRRPGRAASGRRRRSPRRPRPRWVS